SRPPRSRKPPKVSMYALTTQASDVCEKPRSARMDGSATFTIVVSSTIIRLPRHSTISASHRVRLSVGVIGERPFDSVRSVLQVLTVRLVGIHRRRDTDGFWPSRQSLDVMAASFLPPPRPP